VPTRLPSAYKAAALPLRHLGRVPSAGLEPALYGPSDRRLCCWATRAGAATRCRPGPSAVRRRSRSRARRPSCRARIRTLTPVAQNHVSCRLDDLALVGEEGLELSSVRV
jgi:hypothetical protein